MTTESAHPLRLATGSHRAGTGRGCAMNVISWENGDTTITDLPACSDPFLSKVVQRVNDSMCTHRGGSDLLCPECSVKVLDLAHRTVGTGTFALSVLDRRRVWVRIAASEAEGVLHLTGGLHAKAAAAIAAARAWADTPTANAAADAANATYAAADAANATYAAYAAANAANAAYAAYAAANAAADAADAAYAAAYAAYAAAYAAYAAANAADAACRLTRAHHIIDQWYDLTGFTPTSIDDELVAQAVAQMLVTS